ncbi:MAG: PEP-CTERM sorting domain-containing protein [Planctomycetaceae bacterium]|nr:PEP-CTERM sorting domain-containing protein [Planctomycetaceae bacterium]
MRRHFPSRLAESFFLHRIVAVLLLLAFLLGGESGARADTWNGVLSSDWFLSGNWNNVDGPPTGTDDASFPSSGSFGLPVPRTDVSLNASTTVRGLFVFSPINAQYTFTGSNSAVLTATEKIQFSNSDRQALNVHTVSSLGLNTPEVEVFHNAVVALNNATVTTNKLDLIEDGRVDVNSGSSVQTLRYEFDNAAGEVRVNSGGELRIAGDTTLLRGTTTINSGGQLNALPTVDLEYNGSARLQINTNYTLDDVVHLKATGGGDIVATEYLDVGNGNTGLLTVDGAGSTLTSQFSISDWGTGSAGNATVTVSNSGVATASSLRAGTGGATFVGNVTSGGTLRTTSTFRMGGGSTNRTVSLTVNGGTLETAGLATFDDKAALSLVSGAVNFNGGATFNAGSVPVWAGGAMNLGANSTLLIDGANFTKSSGASVLLTDGVTMRIRNGGSFETETNSFLDLGSATLDMNGGFFRVGLSGGTAVSDWGRNPGTATTATLTNSSQARYESGLRMSQLGGTTSTTISGGASLVANGLLTTGGNETSSVTLNINGGGLLRSFATVSLQRGTTATVSGGGRLEGGSVVLDGTSGASLLTVSGVGSTLGVDQSLAVNGPLSVLTVTSGGLVNAVTTGTGSFTVNGAMNLVDGDVQTPMAVAITNSSTGAISATGGSELRADVVSDGYLELFGSTVTRGLTLRSGSTTFADAAQVRSLVQDAGATLNVRLFGATTFDDLSVTGPGAASLAGTVSVSLEGGYTPAAGASFPFLNTNSFVASLPTFDFSLATLPAGLSWGVTSGPTGLGLAVVPASTPGDFDLDGDVDGADFLKWQRGESTTPFSAGDLEDWQANYGPGMLTATSVAVPEPSSLVLLILATVGGCVRRRT